LSIKNRQDLAQQNDNIVHKDTGAKFFHFHLQTYQLSSVVNPPRHLQSLSKNSSSLQHSKYSPGISFLLLDKKQQQKAY